MKTTLASQTGSTAYQVSHSSHAGMGAMPYSDGTAFRVWAPNADQVYVVGTFNDWAEEANPLAREDKGYWSADVPSAKPGDEYRYLIICGEQRLSRIDPYARELTNSVGNSIICDTQFDWGSADFGMPAFNELVIYEVHVGTFNDKPGGPPGDFQGIVQKLGYLKELGINAIQLMPPTEFPGGFSWGYNPAHPFAVEQDYGGAYALKRLVKAAHDQGLAVIFDVVYNHWGPSDLGLWQFDGWSENGKGGIYFYNDWRSQTPWGDTRPDYGRGEVRQYIRDNALMWLEEYQVDGLRWDATAFVRNVLGNEADPSHDLPEGWSLMQWINEEVKSRHPGKITMAEDLKGNVWMTRDIGAGGAGFDSQWDAYFVHPVREAIIIPDDADRNVYAVRDAIVHRYEEDAFHRVIYTESHDEVANGKARVAEEISPASADSWFSKKRSTLGAAIVFTAPGIPMLFQAQEMLEDRWFHDQDPVDWSRTKRFSGIVALYRDLIHLRRNFDGNTRGLVGQYVDVHHLNDEGKVLAYHRWDQGGPRDSVMVVVNMCNRAYDDYNIGFPREGVWRVRFNSDYQGYDESFGNHLGYDTEAIKGAKDGMPCNGNLGIGPYSVLILSQDS